MITFMYFSENSVCFLTLYHFAKGT